MFGRLALHRAVMLPLGPKIETASGAAVRCITCLSALQPVDFPTLCILNPPQPTLDHRLSAEIVPMSEHLSHRGFPGATGAAAAADDGKGGTLRDTAHRSEKPR